MSSLSHWCHLVQKHTTAVRNHTVCCKVSKNWHLLCCQRRHWKDIAPAVAICPFCRSLPLFPKLSSKRLRYSTTQIRTRDPSLSVWQGDAARAKITSNRGPAIFTRPWEQNRGMHIQQVSREKESHTVPMDLFSANTAATCYRPLPLLVSISHDTPSLWLYSGRG